MATNRLNGATHNGRGKPAVSGGVNGQEGRDTRTGQFVAGNKIGAGNPFNRRLAELRTQLVEAVGSDGMGRLARALLKHAEAGDLASAKLLLAYTVGKPVASVHPDDLAVDELARAQQGARAADCLNVGTVSPAVAMTLVRLMQRLALQLTVSSPAGQLVGLSVWDKVFADLNDPNLLEWWREQVEARLEEAMAAGGKAGRADGAGGADEK
jgi:hypothetical protein